MKKKYANKSRHFTKKGRVAQLVEHHNGILDRETPPTLSPPLLHFPEDAQVIEIPEGWQPVTAMRVVKGKPSIFRVLLKTTPKRLQRDYNGRRRKKTA